MEIKHFTSRLSAGLLIIGCLTIITVTTKPLNDQKKISKATGGSSAKADLLETFASDASPQTIIYEQTDDPLAAHKAEMQYIYQAQPETAAYVQEIPQVRTQQQGPAKQAMVLMQPNQYVQKDDGQTSADCMTRHEYVSLAGLTNQQSNQPQQQQQNHQQPAMRVDNNDNQGEVIYANQNGELSPGKETMSQVSSIQSIGSTIDRITGLPATILTEIPANDMPGDVLEKLKRDYGVKVVATRERPGANLVINCDDYANAESSICAPQNQPSRMQDYNMHQGASAYELPPPGYSLGEQYSDEHAGRSARIGRQIPSDQPRGAYPTSPMEAEQLNNDYVTESSFMGYPAQAEQAKHRTVGGSAQDANVEITRSINLVRPTIEDNSYRARTTPPIDQKEMRTQASGLFETTIQVEPSASSEGTNSQNANANEQQKDATADHKQHQDNVQYYTRQDS